MVQIFLFILILRFNKPGEIKVRFCDVDIYSYKYKVQYYTISYQYNIIIFFSSVGNSTKRTHYTALDVNAFENTRNFSETTYYKSTHLIQDMNCYRQPVHTDHTYFRYFPLIFILHNLIEFGTKRIRNSLCLLQAIMIIKEVDFIRYLVYVLPSFCFFFYTNSSHSTSLINLKL